MLRLLGIGVAAGLFSALFGVGGGVVVVPLLIYAGFAPRTATATSLAAISLTATIGAVSFALHGELKPGAAALVGIPAALGAVVGARLQQLVTARSLVLLFAVLLAAVGVRLLI